MLYAGNELRELSYPIKNELGGLDYNFKGLGYDKRNNYIVVLFAYSNNRLLYCFNLKSASWGKMIYTDKEYDYLTITNLFYGNSDNSLKYWFEYFDGIDTWSLQEVSLFADTTSISGAYIVKYLNPDNPKLKKKFLRLRILGKGNIGIILYDSQGNQIKTGSFNYTSLDNYVLDVLTPDYYLKLKINLNSVDAEIREIGLSYRYMRGVK